MNLAELLQGLTHDAVPSIPITGVACHSKQIREGELFVAVRGPQHDGHLFLEEAMERGACAVVAERPPLGRVACPVIVVPDTRAALIAIAARFYGQPLQRLRLVGVTGTCGKTTTAYLVKAILEHATGQPVGLLGTVAYEIGPRHLPSTNTTPGPLELQRLFAQMVRRGAHWGVMEVSSHALDQGRIDGLAYDAAVLTNLGSDHLDYHGSLDRYAAAKRRLFSDYRRPGGRIIVNADDAYGRALAEAFGAQAPVTYSVEHPSAVRVRRMACDWQGTELVLDSRWGTFPLRVPLIGRYNAINVAAACATGLAVGADIPTLQRALADVPPVPGRFDVVPNDVGIRVVIDFGHTADALRVVLLTLRELVRGRLIVVFGCGGDRDVTKRPAMGQVASLLADHVIVTSDNPRREDPWLIMRHIKAGFVPGYQHAQMIVDREQAIAAALAMARADDAVLIAGKGHETTQIFRDVTVPFSDREVVERLLVQASHAAVMV